MVLEAVASNERDIPDYVEVNAAKMTGTFLRQPKLEDIPYPVKMEPNFVIEFYSKN
jgi:small subunit ribosomal protein S4